MTKINEKEKAICLRRDQGMSIKNIADELKVSKGTVSLWVRDIILSQEQKNKLEERCFRGSYEARMRGGQTRRKIYYERRRQYQEEGRRLFLRYKNDLLFVSGIVMYWCEGHKTNNKNRMRFSNSDVHMMEFFIDFLRKYYDVKNEQITLVIDCYLNNGLSLSEIENYWLTSLGLSKDCSRKHRVNYYPKSSKKRTEKNKLPYGVCHLSVGDTKVIQSIYGAIQEYGRFDRPEWLG